MTASKQSATWLLVLSLAVSAIILIFLVGAWLNLRNTLYVSTVQNQHILVELRKDKQCTETNE